MTKYKPATPLPWVARDTGHVRIAVRADGKGLPISGLRIQQQKTGAGRGMSPRWTGFDQHDEQEFSYLLHAANAYPRLVEALRDLREAALLARTGAEMSYDAVQRADATLRELGELE